MNGLRAQLLTTGSISPAAFAALQDDVEALEIAFAALDSDVAAIELNYPRGRLFVPTINTGAVLTNLTAVAGETGMFTDAGSPVANRLYRITVKVGRITKNTATGVVTVRAKIGATVYGVWELNPQASDVQSCELISNPTTLPAGAQTFLVSVQTSTDTVTATNGANGGGFILVEDIGPS